MNTSNWKPFELGRIFNIKYGVNLELNSCEESNLSDAINFVSRSENNNGVSAKISRIDGISPQKKGLISVASGGSSVLSAFVQEDVFYSGRDLYVLDCKENISLETKLFITTLIEANKYRYSFGRQANKTLHKLELILPIKYDITDNPVIDPNKEYSDDGFIPDWEFMDNYIKSLHHKPLTTCNIIQRLFKPADNWKDFTISRIFNVEAGIYYYPDQYEEGNTPYVSASDEENGISKFISLSPDFEGNKITIGKIGATAYYQPFPFCATSDVNILSPSFDMSPYVGIFITSIINFSENYKWSYGRQCRIGDTNKITIKLPIQCKQSGQPIIDELKKFSDEGYIPDWEYMENYIKSLPYGDRLAEIETNDD